MPSFKATQLNRRNIMKVKSNVRAGKQNQKRGSSTDSSSADSAPVYVPPVSRCVGI